MICHSLLLAGMHTCDDNVVNGRGEEVLKGVTRGHHLPLIDSTTHLIAPNRGLLPLLRELEFEVDDGSSAAEKPIFASLLARAICCDRSRCCSNFGGTQSVSSRVDETPRGSGGPWNDRLCWTYSSGEESV